MHAQIEEGLNTGVIAVIAACVVVWALVSRRLERINITAPIAFVLLGLAVTHPPRSLIHLGLHSSVIRAVAELTLALVLFADASRVNVRALRVEAGLPVRLLAIGLPLTIGAGAAAAFGAMPTTWCRPRSGGESPWRASERPGGSGLLMIEPSTVTAAERRLGHALRRRRRLHEGLVQLIYILVAAALAVLVPRIPVGFTVPGDQTKAALLSISAAIVPFIGIVFSLLFLVVQFGSTTFTPRLNLFRHAPIVWHAFSYFSAVFVFSFVAAFTLPPHAAVSGLVPVVVGVAVLAAFAVFRTLQFTAFNSIQLAPSLAQVTARGHDLIEDIYPGEADGGPPPAATADSLPASAERHELLWPGRFAVLQFIDVPRLLRAAENTDVVIELGAGTGETLATHDRVAVVHGPAPASVHGEILKALRTGAERTFEQDPGLALRVLADIALRALSPAINDPTSAVQALDGIDSLLLTLVTRDLDAGKTTDVARRLILALPSWDDYLGVALTRSSARQPARFRSDGGPNACSPTSPGSPPHNGFPPSRRD